MISFVVVAVMVSCAGAAVREYPAGVNPISCPNYPFCNTHGGVPLPHPPHHLAATLPASLAHAKLPAGVNPALCPNYPYCNIAAQAAPVPQSHQPIFPQLAQLTNTFNNREYPAGVNPAICPNYPYCA